jgi:hemerythrin superfamily protein
MNATKLLKEQHDEVKELFEQFEKAKDAGTKELLFEQIADNLAAHAEIEEKIFYPAVYVGDLKETLTEAVEEHLSAKRVIADLLKMDAADENFDAKVKVLQEQIEHHVEEEEGELFPKVNKNFDAGELEAMGEQMEEMFETLKEGSPREEVPAQTDQAAPLQ